MKESGQPSENQMQFLEQLPPLIQLAKSYYEQQDQFRKLAFSDLETGLPNIHAFKLKINSNLAKGIPHFIAVVQPGEYSKIVDLYGRKTADELFVQLAKRIEKEGKDKNNYVARFSSSSLVLTNDLLRVLVIITF